MKELRKNALEFLSECEGYHQLCKGLHWSTDNKSEHTLVDDIDKCVLSFQDRIAEVVMGLCSEKFTIGELQTLLPNAKTTEKMLNELEDDVCNFKTKIGEEIKISALHNVLDDFLEQINAFKYIRTLK